MMLYVIFFLILGLVPALFPRWRDTLIATAVYLGLVLAAFILALIELEKTSGEGPAFFGIMFYFGGTQFLVGASYWGKIIAGWLSPKLSLSMKARFLKRMLKVFLSIGTLAFFVHLANLGDIMDLLLFFQVLMSPFLWISLAIWFMRNVEGV